MKKISFLLLAFAVSASTFAQLENTKWKSTVTIDGPVNVIFDFKKTTVDLYRIADNCNDRSSVLDGTEWKAWKEYIPAKVADAILKQYVGVYQLDAAHPITLTLDNNILYAEGPNNNLPKSPLTPVSETKFFLRIAGVEWDFIKDSNGKVIKLISHEEKDYELKKIK